MQAEEFQSPRTVGNYFHWDCLYFPNVLYISFQIRNPKEKWCYCLKHSAEEGVETPSREASRRATEGWLLWGGESAEHAP